MGNNSQNSIAKTLAFIRGFLSAKSFSNLQQLERFQAKKLRTILTQHGTRFYPVSDDISDFPIITKREFMENFTDINSVGINEREAIDVAIQAEHSRDFSPQLETTKGCITVGLSSGTSGSRGVFLVSPEESARWAGYMCRRLLPKPYIRKHSIAFFLRANSNLYESVNGKLIDFSFYDLMNPITEHIEVLNAQQPSVLIAPAQVLLQLSLSDTLTIAPEKIISVAEVLTPETQEIIQHRFNTIVHQVYQCTEGFLAHTCLYGNLHLNEDLVYIEKDWLDKSIGRFSPIVTDFNRKTQPVLRYRLDDILIENKEPCPCGSVFTRLRAIEGRCDDIIYGATHITHERYALYPDFVQRAMISVDDIQEYRVEQHKNCLHVAIQPFSMTTQVKVKKALKMLCDKHHINHFELRFERYEPQPLHEKRRRVVRISKHSIEQDGKSHRKNMFNSARKYS